MSERRGRPWEEGLEAADAGLRKALGAGLRICPSVAVGSQQCQSGVWAARAPCPAGTGAIYPHF